MAVLILGLLLLTAGAIVGGVFYFKPDKLTAKKWEKYEHKPTNDD